MKKTFSSLLLTLALALNAGAKENVSVLYVGGSPDFSTIGRQVDSAAVAKSVKERTADFTKFLKQRFKTVKAVDGSAYSADMSKDFDVTVFDGKPKALRPEIRETDANGRMVRYEKAVLLPYDFDRAAVCIAEASENVGRSIGTKNDWFCLCLDNYALGWDKDHAIFKGPFKVEIKSEMLPTPEHALQYCPLYGYTLPAETEMWKMHEAATEENGIRIGMVSRPWGYTDSPETEVISGGKCAKSIDAVAIGRHGNFFHWGFAAKPSDLTESAKAALANAIVYMKDFNGKHVIARKRNEGIATRAQATADKYLASRDCWNQMYEDEMKYYQLMDSMISDIKARQAKGEKLSDTDMMYLQFPAPRKPVKQPFSVYLKGRVGNLYDVFGEDEEEYARYYDKNRPYFYALPDSYGLTLDQEARSLGIANNDIRILDKAIELLEKGGEEARTGRTLLERYTLCRFDSPQEWKAWLDANRDRMFFTESGGWLWLVDTLDPTVPGNDYSVLDAKKEQPAAPAKAKAGKTDEENPVALESELVKCDDGSRELVLTMTIHPGFHAYASLDPEDPFIATKVSNELPEGVKRVGEIVKPTPKPTANATTHYEGTVQFRQKIAGDASGEASWTITYQVCDNSVCKRPETKTVKTAI